MPRRRVQYLIIPLHNLLWTYHLSHHTILLHARELHGAMRSLTQIDVDQAKAVETRQELDLRTGAVFTRLLTLTFREYIPVSAEPKVISYGEPHSLQTILSTVMKISASYEGIPIMTRSVSISHPRLCG